MASTDGDEQVEAAAVAEHAATAFSEAVTAPFTEAAHAATPMAVAGAAAHATVAVMLAATAEFTALLQAVSTPPLTSFSSNLSRTLILPPI
jgi:hypothetical protein